jgi:hypothetical protein
VRSKVISAMAIGLASCCAAGCAPVVNSKTPAGIEFDCYGGLISGCGQKLADEAEKHCQQYGMDARLKDVGDAALRRWADYDCVKLPTGH